MKYSRDKQLADAERDARANRKGLWADPCDWRARERDGGLFPRGTGTLRARARERCLRNGRIAFLDFASRCDQQRGWRKARS